MNLFFRYVLQYQEPIPCEQLVCTLCDVKQAYTQFGGKCVSGNDERMHSFSFQGSVLSVCRFSTWGGTDITATSCTKVTRQATTVAGKQPV